MTDEYLAGMQTFSHKRFVWRFALPLFVSILIAASAVPGWADDSFFDGPAATPGDRMFFSIYSILPLQKGNTNMQKIADGGFTAAGPYYGNEGNPTVNSAAFYLRVGEAASSGLKYIAHIPNHPSVIDDTEGKLRPDSIASITEASLRSHVRTVMDFTLNDSTANATVSNWYTQPEELRQFKPAEMNYLSIVADEIHKYDPQNRPVTMYNPNHRSSGDLETIVGQGLDRTMMGVYATSVPFNTRGARVADGMNRIVTAANNTSTTPVATFELSTDYDSSDIQGLRTALGGVSEADAIEHVIRHDVYQGLLSGIEGVQIWSGCDCRTGLTTYSDQLEGYISVSEDLNQSLNLADVFLQGETRNDFAATVLSGSQTVTHDGTTIDTVTLADIAHGDARYLFLANSSNEMLEISVSGLPSDILLTNISDLFENAPELLLQENLASQGLLNDLRLDMQPLEVIAFRIQASAVPEPSNLIALFILAAPLLR